MLLHVFIETRADGIDTPVIAPPRHIVINRVGMLLVIDHDIRPITHIAQSIDTLQVLLYRRAVIDQRIDNGIMVVRSALGILLIGLQAAFDILAVLVPVLCKVYLFDLYLTEHLRFLRCHQPCIQTLVKIHRSLAVDELLQERLPFLACEDIRVAEDYLLLSVPELRQVGYFLTGFALFGGNVAEGATARTTASEETVSGIVGQFGIKRVVRVDVLYLIGQGIHELIAVAVCGLVCSKRIPAFLSGNVTYHKPAAAFDDFVGVDRLRIVRRPTEYLGDIDRIVLLEAVIPFHGVTLRLVVGGEFHQRYVRKRTVIV